MFTRVFLRVRAVAVIVFVLCLICIKPIFAAESGAKKWHPWFEFGGYYNNDDASRGEVTLFLPIMQSHDNLTFFDARGKFFEEDVTEGNFAIGFRQMMNSGFNLGAWIGGDVRSTELQNTFFQLSGGFEALSHDFDARVNWYGPVTDPQGAGDPSFTRVILQGNNIFMIGGEEVALYGVDGEIGVRLPVEMVNMDQNQFELRVYGGGFYFDHEDALEEVAGGKGRVELRINDLIASLPGSRLTADYEFSYDDVREERHQVGLRIRLPFGQDASGKAFQLASLNNQERRMADRLERDTDIITVQSEAEGVEDAITNVDFDRVQYVNDGGSITTTSTNEGDNRLLIVNGTIDDGTQVVQDNQTVMGGGSTIQVRGLKSGTIASFNSPGTKPMVINMGGGNVISLAGDNIHIDGLLIDGNNNGANGIGVGSGKNNIAITQNMIQNTFRDGINFGNNNSMVRILNNMFTNVRVEGIDINNDNTDFIISGNVITPGSDGIVVEDRNSNFLISGNTITIDTDEGIEFDDNNNNITIVNNTVTSTGDEAIEIDDNNTNITISNNILSSVDEEAIEFDDNNMNILIANNMLSSNTDEALQFDNGNTAVVIRGNTLSTMGANATAIEFDNNNAFDIIGNIFNTVGDRAIDIANNNTVTISDNIFNGPIGNFLLDVNGAGSVLTGTGNIANVPITCQSGTFMGTVTFANSVVVLQDGVAPCN